MPHSYDYDAIVIGSGPGGEGAAMGLVKQGARVAVIERYQNVGGGCTHWGTIPSKALRHAVSRIIEFNQNPLYSDHSRLLRSSFADILNHADNVINQQTRMRQGFYERNHCEILQGNARFVDELGLTMVDESGLMLRQLMRQARQRIAKGGSVIRTSVSTFMEFIGNNPNAFRLLLRERSGTSAAFRAAVAREIQHFIAELADYLELENHMPRAFTEAQAEAMVTIVFSAGAEALDVGVEQRRQLEERLVLQLRMISKGAYYWYRREQEKTAIIPGNVKDE
jgi:TetR/AcrR family transcriptional regulator, fatty acid biosynthesis regulator